MPLTKPVAETLAHLAHQLRGWDEVGVLANLAKVTHRSELDVAMALVRFCGDPKVKTPGAFPNLAGPHWTERITVTSGGRPNPKPHEECGHHPGQYALACGGCGADRRAVREAADSERAEAADRNREAALTAMRTATAAAKSERAAQAATRTTAPLSPAGVTDRTEET